MKHNNSVEIFAIGSELVTGLIQDTNSSYLAARITELGGRVVRMTVLPDEPEWMRDAFQAAIDRGTAVVITCGGLGPTPDDLTVSVLSRFAGVDTEIHEPLLQEFMRRRGLTDRRDVTPNLVKMATVPKGSTVLTNPAGWAPCIGVAIQGTVFYALPGPPRELEGLFVRHLSGILANRFESRRVVRRVRVNMHESEVSPSLQTVMSEFPQTYLKAYVALRKNPEAELPLDIVAVGTDEKDACTRLEAATDRLRELVEAQGKYLRLESS